MFTNVADNVVIYIKRRTAHVVRSPYNMAIFLKNIRTRHFIAHPRPRYRVSFESWKLDLYPTVARHVINNTELYLAVL